MASALLPRELLSWSLVAIGMAALEGGLLAVIVKNHFAGAASPAVINFAVALVAGAPSYANLSSFYWSRWVLGRDKPAALARLMQVIAACLLLMGLAGRDATGLLLFAAATILARAAWSGMMTIRVAVWRANFQRRWRGRVTAQIIRVSSLLLAATGALVGWLMDWNEDAFRLIFPALAGALVAASLIYRRVRVRRNARLLRDEIEADQESREHGVALGAFTRILRHDRGFRRYMTGMMILGFGNLMTIPMLVVLINERFEIAQWQQVMITSSIPLAVLVMVIPLWARFLDQRHIIQFRAIHSWFFACAITVYCLAVILGMPSLLWVGALIMGTAWAGGHLGWTIGHDDFAEDGTSTQYMAIHVTLTGVRGLLGPVTGIAFYQALQQFAPGWSHWAMLLPASMTICGAIYFVRLSRRQAL